MEVKETITVNIIDDSKFDKFALAHYGHNPEIAASEEWHNDSSHLYKIEVGDRAKWTVYDDKGFGEFLHDGYASYGITRKILEDLVANGHMPPGNYLVVLSW